MQLQACGYRKTLSIPIHGIRAQARRLQAMLEDVRAQRGSPAPSDSAKSGAGPGRDEGADGQPGAADLAPAVSLGGTMRLPGEAPTSLGCCAHYSVPSGAVCLQPQWPSDGQAAHRCVMHEMLDFTAFQPPAAHRGARSSNTRRHACFPSRSVAVE